MTKRNSITKALAATVSKAIGHTVEIDAGSVLVVYGETDVVVGLALTEMLRAISMVDPDARVGEWTHDDDLGHYGTIVLDWNRVEQRAAAKVAELRA